MKIPARGSRRGSQGQMLAVFVIAIFVLTGIVAIVVDVSWYWSNSLRVQRAADAAALAGVVYLPGDVTRAVAAANLEATKNGYTSISLNPPTPCPAGQVCVYPTQDPANPRRMRVTINAPVNTFFMRIFGFSSITAIRNSKAEYVLPVPMGSPQNYYGVGFFQGNSGPQPVLDPNGVVLAPQNFWGAMQSQGAPNIQGDAFLAKYADRSPLTLNGINAGQDPDAVYDPVNYYNYGVDIPAGATNGQVWIYDPGFCEVATNRGTGESWTVGLPNGYSSAQPVSAFYELYDTLGTPYDLVNDPLIASSGNTFRQLTGDDATLGGTRGSTDCRGLAWHNGWWQLASGLTGGALGTTYRVHTTSTDAGTPNDQDNTTALNAFAIWATATGGTPRVYGTGAMQAYVRLPGGVSSTFYLAQIDATHAGKTMLIDLWDPGDTGALSAYLEILQPTSSGYAPASFSYSSIRGSTDANASNCNAVTGASTSVVTNTGGSSRLNGCWLRMTIALPSSYSAPVAPGETEPGWWKIRYTMGGSSSSYSTDMTTWKVSIRGNPVHLVVP